MGKTMSTTRNQNYDVPSSDPNHDVLSLVIMRLGVVDFLAFSGVCKSWRSFALANKKRFMASRPPMYIRNISPSSMSMGTSHPPMSMCIPLRAYKLTCHLEDSEGRKFKTILPHSAGRVCVGVTCGYLILFGRKTHDFWLLNPVTRHQLHFPHVPFHVPCYTGYFPYSAVKAILVFLRSVSGWLIFLLERPYSSKIWYSIEGKGAWNHVSVTFPIIDIHSFKGKIYTLNDKIRDAYELCEMRLNPDSKLILLETKTVPKAGFMLLKFVSYGEKLYVIQHVSAYWFELYELDSGEIKRVCREKTKNEYEFYWSDMNHNITAFKGQSWWTTDIHRNREGGFSMALARVWYFPHECLNVNLIHE